MFPDFTVAMARDAVARQFDYDDASKPPVARRGSYSISIAGPAHPEIGIRLR